MFQSEKAFPAWDFLDCCHPLRIPTTLIEPDESWDRGELINSGNLIRLVRPIEVTRVSTDDFDVRRVEIRRREYWQVV